MKSSNQGAVLSFTPDAGSGPIGVAIPAPALEELYSHYNRFEHIHPDPLEFVYLYEKKPERELSAFIASALAYGRVQQILCSVRTVLDTMGPSPSSFLLEKGVPTSGSIWVLQAPFHHGRDTIQPAGRP